MLFDFEQSVGLMTPTIIHGGVNDVNPMLTSSHISSLDDQDIYFSSTPPSKNIEHHLQQQQQQPQDDLYVTFDFPVLSEFSRTGKTDNFRFSRLTSSICRTSIR